MKKEYLVTYDVHENHEQIIKDLLAAGWHSVKPAYEIGTRKPVFCYLPETTWYKSFENTTEATEEFIKIAGGASNVIRQMVTSFSDWQGSIKNPMPHQVEEAKHMRLLPVLN